MDAQQLIVHTQSPYYIAWKALYNQAFRLYMEGRWNESLVEFDKCIKLYPKDGPSLTIREFI